MSHQVNTVFNKGMSFTANIDDHKVIMDTMDDGGHNTGARPKKLMLAALAGCTGIDVVSILNKMKVAFSNFSIDVEASLTEKHPRMYKKVKVLYKIHLAETDHHKMEKAVRLSRDKYCGVNAMFREFAKVETDIHYL